MASGIRESLHCKLQAVPSDNPAVARNLRTVAGESAVVEATAAGLSAESTTIAATASVQAAGGSALVTGAINSTATTLPEIIKEMLLSTSSEREGRLIDKDQEGAMELKKIEGYF